MDLSSINLEAIIERNLGAATGDPPAWCCPFHNDHDPSLKLWPDEQHWRCFGCGLYGDAIDWLEERRGLTFLEACEELGVEIDGDGRQARPERHAERQIERRTDRTTPEPPSETWRAKAEALVGYAQDKLWSEAGADALAYLRNARGLTDETIRYWELGWHDRDRWRKAVEWGIESDKKIWLPEGIVIPWRVDGVLWFVNIRRLKDGEAIDDPKYIGAKGGRRPLYGIDNLRGKDAVFVCEGEFDGLLLWQEARDLADVVALGGAENLPDATFLVRLAGAPRWFVVTDLDDAGEKGARKWRRYSGRVKRIGSLQGNDLTDFWRQEGDLRTWVEYHLGTDARLDAVGAKQDERVTEHDALVEAERLLKSGFRNPDDRRRYAEIGDRLGWPCWGATWQEWASDSPKRAGNRDL